MGILRHPSCLPGTWYLTPNHGQGGDEGYDTGIERMRRAGVPKTCSVYGSYALLLHLVASPFAWTKTLTLARKRGAKSRSTAGCGTKYEAPEHLCLQIESVDCATTLRQQQLVVSIVAWAMA